MRHEILALLPEGADPPELDELSFVRVRGFIAVFVPARQRILEAAALRRARLATAAKRQSWLEAIMPGATVLPFAPGSVLRPADAEALVAANHDTLGSLVHELRGRVQYQVSIDWAEDRVLQRFRDAPEIVPLFSETSVSPSRLAGSVARLASRLSRAVAGSLRSISADFAELPLGDGMLFNGVVLLDQDREDELTSALEEADAIWTEGFRIRQIGPSPATSFVSLRLSHHNPREVEQAFRTLELPMPASEARIREERRRLLRGEPSDRARVQAAARLAIAASRMGVFDREVLLIDRWSEGRAESRRLETVA